jgi:hypothetical protein
LLVPLGVVRIARIVGLRPIRVDDVRVVELAGLLGCFEVRVPLRLGGS